MCFTRKKPYDKVRANIAENDIFVYKWLDRDRKSKILSSPYEDFDWEKGKVYSEPLFSMEMFDNEKNIHRGFHSLRSVKDAVLYKERSYMLRACALYKVCIPKGSLYYINDTEIVSNKCCLVDDKAVRVRKN